MVSFFHHMDNNLNFVVSIYQEKQWQTTGSFKQFNLEMRRIQGSKVTADNSLQFSIYSFAHTSVAWYEFGRWAPDHFDCVRQNTDSFLRDLRMVVAASSFEHVSLSSLTSLAMRITKLLVFAVTRTHPHLSESERNPPWIPFDDLTTHGIDFMMWYIVMPGITTFSWHQ